MPRAKAQEVAVEQPEEVTRPKAEEVPDVLAEEGAAAEAKEFVSMEEYDRFVKDVRNQISELTERISDLEVIAAEPTGAVQWLEVERPGDPAAIVHVGDDADDVPEYSPNDLHNNDEDTGTPWYSG